MARLGCEVPRVWTPPLRELTPATTLGYDVIDFARDYLDIDLLPWERWLFIHGLEIVGDFDGDWHLRYRIVLVLVARQNGKSVMGMVLSLFFMYVLGARLILGTAQDLSQAEEVWEGAVNMAQDNPDLAAEIEQVMKGKGSKELRLEGYRRYKVATPNRKNTRGKTSNLVLLDELREHQTFQAWSAASKTTKAVKSGLVWCMSNAGDGASVVLRHLRTQAHAAIGDPDGICGDNADAEPDEETAQAMADAMSSIAIFEWSAPPNCDKWDRDAWAQSNPSMGYGFLDESTIATDCASDPEEEFRVEDLCQWVTSTVEPPFPRGAWEAGVDPESEPALDAEPFFGVDVSSDREHTAIAVCAKRGDRKLHGELVEYRPGIAWLVDWFRDRVNEPQYGGRMRVALQGNGAPVSAFSEMLSAIDGVEVTECVGRDLGAWCGRMWDAIAALDPNKDEDGGSDATPMMHRPQPRLDLAANVSVTRPMGDGAWAWDRKRSMEDASPIVALTMAHGLATQLPPPPEAHSAYEDGDLLLL